MTTAAYSFFFPKGSRTVTSVGLFVRAGKFNIVMISKYLPCFHKASVLTAVTVLQLRISSPEEL